MTIPYWHPLVVHFPIALLVVAAGGAAAWAVRGGAFFRRFTLVLLALGSIGAFTARQTGEALEHDMEGDPAVERYVETHEDAATYALAASLLALLALGAAEWQARRRSPPDALAWRLAGALLALIAAGFVVRAGHTGGLMVWGVGAAHEAAPDAPPGAP